MELCEDALKGLSVIANETIINDDILKHILSESISILCASKKQSHPPQTNKLDVLKLAQYSLVSLFTEYLKTNEEQDLADLLIKLKISKMRAELITKCYSESRMNIIKTIAVFNENNVPHITDVTWKLDYVLKNNETLEKDLLYRIQLIGNDEPINFNCNRDQLQDLLFKLKDIHNHCAKIAHSTN